MKVQIAAAAAHRQIHEEKQLKSYMLHLLGSAADFCATIIGNGSILPFSQNVQVMKTV